MASGHRALALIVFGCLIAAEVAGGCQIPLERTRSSFVTAAWIDDRGPFRLLVDSGTSVTIVSRRVAEALQLTGGQTIEASSTTGPVEVTATTIRELRTGAYSRSDVAAFILDLPRFQSHGELDGILGANFLAGESYLLDVRRSCLTVGLPAEHIRGGERMPSTVIAGRVAIDASGMRWTLDSAATMTVLISEKARSLAARGERTRITSAAGTRDVDSAHIAALPLGTLVFKNVPAVLVPGDTGEDGLLPVTLFDNIYVSAARDYVVIGVRSTFRS
ncbi:MAG TPA: retroviral-like aspartic protease family protein [Thermoanaerobaculia bacterium]|nr:retroviral-like aspartic protease family protein [Thermoanaerobaculia bacterium]